MLLEIFYLICTQKLCFKRYNPYTPRQNVGNPRYWPPCPRRNMSQYAKHWWSPNIVMWPLILKEILYWIIIKWLKTHILAVSTFLSHRQAHKWRGFFFTKFTTLNHSYNFSASNDCDAVSYLASLKLQYNDAISVLWVISNGLFSHYIFPDSR